MSFTKNFPQISKGDAAIAGGKGASLGEMTRAGIPVPPGFVVLASAFDRFLDETKLRAEIDAALDKVKHAETHTVEHASETIQALILAVDMPKDLESEIEKEFNKLDATFVAVRSSATAEDSAAAAWAGQLDSYLNTTEETLFQNVQRCWASLFTPRAIFYRFEKKLHGDDISVAVVVQKMVESECSGIAFSVHPVTEDRNQLIIEAGYGLGEAIVSGQVTPDSYVVEKEPLKIIEVSANTQKRALYRAQGGGNEWRDIVEPRASARVLDDNQILELVELVLRIENHYRFPCDIEWAFEKGKFYIVQSRPITTLQSTDPPTLSLAKTESPVLFEKNYAREITLFEASVWRDANCTREHAWVGYNVEEALFFRPNSKNGVEIWYSPQANEVFAQEITKRINADERWFAGIEQDFRTHWEIMFRYIKSGQPLTLEQLREYQEHFVEWWTPMAIAFVVPNLLQLPEKVRTAALRLREETQEYSDQTDEPYLRSIERLYPAMARYARVLLPEEVLSGNLPPESALEARLGGWYLTNDSFGLIQDFSAELTKRNWLLQKYEIQGSEIHGTTAYPGKISGKVKVVLSKHEISKVGAGDILVTSMTSPEYLPYMHKAAAFVTDEGGITCHAAIVAREMKKPCIIGTKGATQVLKDGDMVEVNADSGIVRILDHRAMPQFEDYVLTFETKGTTALFEDLTARHYNANDSVALFRHQAVRLYISKQSIATMREMGITPALLAGYIARLRELVKITKEETHTYQNKTAITRAETEHVFSVLAELCEVYGKFDFNYWDGIYTKKETDPDARAMVTTVEQFKNEIRAELGPVFFEPAGYLGSLLGKLGEAFGLSAEELRWYWMSEVVALFDGKKADRTATEARKRLFVIYRSPAGETSLYEGAEAEHFIESFGEHVPTLVGGVLSGTTAHSTSEVVRGAVKIVSADYGDPAKMQRAIAKMEQGDILVSESTSPELMEALRKAAAIITDVGGLLSHAAITARELNVPCIVGTGFATKALHDGDMVEVDADSGVVKIITTA